jgi:hypothetical protein
MLTRHATHILREGLARRRTLGQLMPRLRPLLLHLDRSRSFRRSLGSADAASRPPSRQRGDEALELTLGGDVR